MPIAVKLTLTPLLIAAATLAARRWGQRVGGLVTGLPLTSGPVSVFLALEHGPHFAARAAVSTLLGLIGVAAFCVAYRHASRVAGVAASCVIALAAYAAALWILSFAALDTIATALLVATTLAVTVAAIGRPRAAAARVAAPVWDLPVRMTAATVMVVVITGAAGTLGPAWRGLLSPFPVFISVMAAFIHHTSGPQETHRLLRGVGLGMFAAAAFFVVAALGLERIGALRTYAAATAAALSVNLIALLVLLRER